jgi:hypothetical protein
MTAEDLLPVRDRMARLGLPAGAATDDQLRLALQMIAENFRDKAPLSAAGAATIILDGVRQGAWRILVGEDAKELDRRVRAAPEEAYEQSFVENLRATGLFGFLIQPLG